jgi:hypothetical protein
MTLIFGTTVNAQSDWPAESLRSTDHQPGISTETITYYWRDYNINVDFTLGTNDSNWEMTVSDSWDIYDQAKDTNKIWGLSSSECSTRRCLQIMEESLDRFHYEKPNAHLDSVGIEMQLVSNVWSEILTSVRQTLLKRTDRMEPPVRTAEGFEPLEVPDAVFDGIAQQLNTSPSSKAIESLLQKHGMKVQTLEIADPLDFRESLVGTKWSKIGAMSGEGIRVPGFFQFDLESSVPRAESHDMTAFGK